MKIKYMLLALIPLCMASCSEEETFVSADNQEVRITAGVGTHSRMVLKDQNTYTQSLWQNGDAISLFTSTQSNLVYGTTLNADSTSASFTPSIMAGQAEKLECIEGNTVYACYPTTTATNENNLIVNIPPTDNIDYKNGKLSSFCYAVNQITNGHLNFNFKHLFAFLCVTVTPDIVPVGNSVNVTVSTSSDAPLSVGEGDTFDFSTLTANTTKGTNTVRMNLAHSNDSIWSIYIPILPQPGNADITITLTNAHEENLYTLTKQTPASGFLAGNVYKLDTSKTFEVAYLVDGPTFNQSIKGLINGGINDEDYLIGKVQFVTKSSNIPENHIIVSAEGSQTPIYASFDQVDSLLTISTSANQMEIEDATYMFSNLKSLRTIDFGNFVINETTTNVDCMFFNCSSLSSLDLSGFYTSKVTHMRFMFTGCSSLGSLDLSGFDTSNVTDMEAMFFNCSSLESLNLSGFNTSKVTYMRFMFTGCSSLSSLDLSGFNTSKVTDMNNMFANCYSLESLNLFGFNTSNVTNMSSMFSGCSSLISLDLSGFDTSNVTNMYGMFANCSSLESLNLSNFDTSNVTDMNNMFANCSSLSSLDLSGFYTANVTNMYWMFYNCSSLSSLDLSNFDTSKVTNMTYMFSDCSSLISLDLSGFDTSNVTDMEAMFSNCSSLISLNLSGFNTSKVTNMRFMFSGCSLSSLDLSGFDTSNVTNMTYMFFDCSALTSLDLSGFDTSNVTDMEAMFSNCSSLTSLDLSGFDTSNVTNMTYMFTNCSSLSSLDLSGFYTANVTNMYWMFSGCYSLSCLDLSNFDTSNVTNMTYMFSDCYSLISLDLSCFDMSNVIYMLEMFYACASTSQACRVTTTQATKEFLLNNTGTTSMNPDRFIWGDAENGGSGFDDMPKEEW